MVGVDYSASSIALASGIGGGEGEGAEGLEFRVWDVMREEHEEEEQEKEWMGGGFDVVLDKGTFDAISLSGDVEGGRRVFEQYPGRIVRLVRPGGLFIVTSCNWTGEEILSLFNVPGLRPHVPGEIRYPSFRFGGSSGQSICTKVFERC